MLRSIQVFPKNDQVFTAARDQPALLRGWASDWKATKLWSFDYLAEHFGDVKVRISNYRVVDGEKLANSKKPEVRLYDYLQAAQGRTPFTEALNSNSYVAGWHFLKNAPTLLDDIEVPLAFKDNILDLINKRVINYDDISLFIGHDKVESPLHTDSFAVSVWLASLFGTKHVRLVSPVFGGAVKNGMDVFSDDVVDTLDSYGIDVIDVILNAGDILFIPPGYWHQVRNLTTTIAVSTNFVSAYHFLPFEQQLRAKLLVPYLRLLEVKREITQRDDEAQYSAESAKVFKLHEADGKLFDYLEQQLAMDRDLLKKV